MVNFTAEQKKFIAKGKINADKLRLMVSEALGVTTQKVQSKRHTYIYSPPGVGKTYTVQQIASQNKIKLEKLQGASSMNAFMLKLAYAVYKNRNKDKDVIFWVDDCDSIFMDNDALNVMKGALDSERNMATWNKNYSLVIKKYQESEIQNEREMGDAMAYFQPAGSVGLEVPTDRVRFIVTSNKPLTPPSAELRTTRKMYEAAIRDRVAYKDFTMDRNTSWGWIAHIAMTNDVMGLEDETKILLLQWMQENWSRLPATSMRAVNDFAAMFINYPDEFETHWDHYLE